MNQEKRLLKRLLAVSSYYPPVVGGTATVIGSLLAAFRPGSFTIVAETPASIGTPSLAGLSDHRHPIIRCGIPGIIRELPYGTRWAELARFAMIPKLTRVIIAAAKDCEAELIVAVYPSWPFLIAAYRAHLHTGIPFATYFMDITTAPSNQFSVRSFFQKRYEKRIMDAAFKHIALSPPLADNLKQRFSVDAVVIPHTVPSKSEISSTPPDCIKNNADKKIIVHTGVVEGLQEENLLRVARLLENHPELNAKLILATPTAPSDLQRRGFNLPCVEIVFLTDDEVTALQAKADILLAVLPFDPGDKHAATAFPTKVMEYLAAERPILALTHSNSYFAAHVKKHGYALLVSEQTETALLNGIHRLTSDDVFVTKLIKNAKDTALSEHALSNVAKIFTDTLGLAGNLAI